MNVEETVKSIKKLYTAVSGLSDHEVRLTYKGTGYGVTLPWHAYIDKREVNAKSHDAALEILLSNLKSELTTKIANTRRDAEALERTLQELS